MITMQEWKVMSGLEQTLWLEDNCQVNAISLNSRKLVQGVGVSDSHYIAQPKIDGKVVACPSYRTWTGMLTRCYCKKYHAIRPTYTGSAACDEWLAFSNFREWWMEHQVDGWELDKDILSCGGKLYSPITCIFVPGWLNRFTSGHGAGRGEWPIGASYNKRDGKYQSNCKNPISGKVEHLGLFDTPEEAHLAWRARKLELALELKPKMDEIDIRIYPRVVEIINNAK